jgi:hypothetical protein
MEKMQNRQQRTDTLTTETLPPASKDPASPVPAGTSSSIPTQTPNAGVKKKKPKKKK